LDKAKQAIRKENLAILVEGNMDVIASYQAGVTNVVASSGTALTAEQIKLLKRYSNNLAISFDADLAGEAASKRGVGVAMEQGMTVKVIVLDPKIGKDPDEYIKVDRQKWIEAIAGARLFMDYYFDYVLNKLDLSKVESKKEAGGILLQEIAKIQNKIEQSHYLQKLGEILNVSEQVLRESITTKAKSASPPESNDARQEKNPSKNRNFLLGERLLALLLKYPENLPYVINHLNPETIKDVSLQELYTNLILYYNSINTDTDRFDLESFCATLGKSQSLRQKIDILLLLAEKDFFDFDEDKIKNEIQKSVKIIRENYFFDERKKIEKEMKEAEGRGDHKKISELSEKFNRLVSINE
jgi:DNA primase